MQIKIYQLVKNLLTSAEICLGLEAKNREGKEGKQKNTIFGGPQPLLETICRSLTVATSM